MNLQDLGKKIRRYREQLMLTAEDVARETGITADQLSRFEGGEIEPTGDEVLVLADFFKCDFQFFISNERVAPFDQTETLYRRYGDEFSRDDRRRIQEFLFLCECERFLEQELGLADRREPFLFKKEGTYYKGHGKDSAEALRRHLGYRDQSVADIFRDIRRLGFHVFRRKLGNSSISGMYVRHPRAGACLLVNYSEDSFRQRFTAAHECAHAILDAEDDVVVSFSNYAKDDLIEIRANAFASNFLIPPQLLAALPAPSTWTDGDVAKWAIQLKVSTEALAYAVGDAGLVDDRGVPRIRRVRIPQQSKVDPELESNLSPNQLQRKKELLERGLSTYYVGLCFDAYHRNVVSRGRLGEILLVDQADVANVAASYGRSFVYGD